MSGSAVAAWQQAIKALEDCCSTTAGLLPGSAEAEAACYNALLFVVHLSQPPALPKAVWKKLVQLKVPLQLGTAYVSASQHSWESLPMRAALGLMLVLVGTALNAGAAAWGSLGSSIRQQLQQSGVLQQLTAVLSAMAADLQAEAATLAAPGADTARPDLEQLVDESPNKLVMKTIRLQGHLMELLGCVTVPFGFDFVSSATWLWGPNGQVVAAMQLHMAVMQHASALVQHVQQHASQQQQGALLGCLAANCQKMEASKGLLLSMAVLYTAASGIGEQAPVPLNAADSLQGLLLSPHTLPYLAMVMVIHAAGIREALAVSSCQSGQSSTAGGSAPSSSRGGSSTAGAGQQQRATAAPEDNSSSSKAASASRTACEAQLLQLLGLAPGVLPMFMDQPQNLLEAAHKLGRACNVCRTCFQAATSRLRQHSPLARQLEQQLQERQQPERLHFEQQLRLLLPIALLSSARHMLAPNAQDLQQQVPEVPDAAQRMLLICSSTLEVAAMCNTSGLPAAPPPAVWLQELLGVVLPLTDQLMRQRLPALAQPTAAAAATGGTAGASSTPHQQAPAPAEEAAATPGTSGCSSSQGRGDQLMHQGAPALAQPTASAARPAGSSKSSCNSWTHEFTAAVCDSHMLSLLLTVARKSQDLTSNRSSGANKPAAGPDRAGTAGAVSPLAARFVEFGAALEDLLRAFSVTLQTGSFVSTDALPSGVSELCKDLLLRLPGQTSPMLVQHMGLCGPVVLAQEQRQLYSLLSTVLKMGRCRTAGAAARLCWGPQAAGSCCLAAAHATVGLLNMAAAVGSAAPAAATDQQSQSAAAAPAPAVAAAPAAAAAAAAAVAAAATPSARAAAQQHPVDYLPSLVIFGRCCLQWAEQLSEQTPDLLLGGLMAVPRERRVYLVHGHSAYFSCIGFIRHGPASQHKSMLGGLIATVSRWVGGLQSRAAVTRLQAAGCAPQQLQQQLKALLSVHQGMQPEKLTDASLAALVQQLQATGIMLCNIAVPHFCNNAACGNLSGPTEVQLVSGRSCVCAGCRTARYCGRACQRAAWRQHKPVCEALAAAAAAPAE